MKSERVEPDRRSSSSRRSHLHELVRASSPVPSQPASSRRVGEDLVDHDGEPDALVGPVGSRPCRWRCPRRCRRPCRRRRPCRCLRHRRPGRDRWSPGRQASAGRRTAPHQGRSTPKVAARAPRIAPGAGRTTNCTGESRADGASLPGLPLSCRAADQNSSSGSGTGAGRPTGTGGFKAEVGRYRLGIAACSRASIAAAVAAPALGPTAPLMSAAPRTPNM